MFACYFIVQLVAKLKKLNVKDPFSFIVVGPMDSHTRVNTG